MNDFTKDELQHIYDGLLMLSKLGWEKGDLIFRYKIQSMIENHSEHKCNHVSQYMTFKTIYEPPQLTFENFHDVCSEASGIYKCIKCKSNDIDTTFIIKFGLHEWFLCNKCSSKFIYLVRNDNVLEEVPDGYGHWTFKMIKVNENDNR